MNEPEGFSDEAWAVVQRKPNARIIDVTAGNRHIWGKEKMRDDVIFTDKESRLKIAPDLLCEWRDLPKHFPRDYFHCAIFDPPFYIGNALPWFNTGPAEDVKYGPKTGAIHYYGEPYPNKRRLIREFYDAQEAIAKITPRLCLKWTDRDLSIYNALSFFSSWNMVWLQPFNKNKVKTQTWWVKLVRKGYIL